MFCLFLLQGMAAAEHAQKDSLQEGSELPQALVRAPLTATEQTVGAVRWMAKRRQFTLRGTPYGVTGLPFVFYSPNTGWNYGTRLHWADYRRRPYRYKLTLHVQKSSAGKVKNRLRLKVPRISGTGFGLRLEASLERNLRTRYYGLGNDSVNDKSLLDRKSPDYKDENYYHYILKEDPRLILSLLRHIYGPVSMSTGLGLERTDVDPLGRKAFYLDQGTPDGVKDGFTGFLSLTLEWAYFTNGRTRVRVTR
jgi:hypothetical protein